MWPSLELNQRQKCSSANMVLGDHGHLHGPGRWAAKFNVVYIRINDFSVQLDATLGGRPRNEKHAREMHSV